MDAMPARSSLFRGDLDHQIAQLRHAYGHLVAGRLGDPQAFADGLIAPAIRFLETIQATNPGPTSEARARRAAVLSELAAMDADLI